MTRAVAVVALLVGAACSKTAAPEETAERKPAMSVEEIRQAKDACTAYVEQVCACAKTVAALADECKLAHGAPEAVQLGLDVAARPETSSHDAAGALASVRKAVKNCIEATAKLPAAGCR